MRTNFLFIDEAGNINNSDSDLERFVVSGILVDSEKYKKWLYEKWQPLIYSIPGASGLSFQRVPLDNLDRFLYIHANNFFVSSLTPYWQKWFSDSSNLHKFQMDVIKCIGSLDFKIYVASQASSNAHNASANANLLPSYLWCASYIIERAVWAISNDQKARSDESQPSAMLRVIPETQNSYAKTDDPGSGWKLRKDFNLARYVKSLKSGVEMLPFYWRNLTTNQRSSFLGNAEITLTENDRAAVDSEKKRSVATMNWVEEKIVVSHKHDHIAGTVIADLIASGLKAFLAYSGGDSGALCLSWEGKSNRATKEVFEEFFAVFNSKLVKDPYGEASSYGFISVAKQLPPK